MNNFEIGISKKSIIWYLISYRETTGFQNEFYEPVFFGFANRNRRPLIYSSYILQDYTMRRKIYASPFYLLSIYLLISDSCQEIISGGFIIDSRKRNFVVNSRPNFECVDEFVF